MLAAIARTRPIRSPSQPKTSPPLAAPNRNAALYHENQRGTSACSCLGFVGAAGGGGSRQLRLAQAAG